MNPVVPILRLVTGRKRLSRERVAELERADRLACAQAEIDYHLAIVYRCREIAYEELDRFLASRKSAPGVRSAR